MPDATSSGLLIIGHGTREPQGIADFLTLVDQVAALLPDVPVEPCFLELAQPTIREGVQRLARRTGRIHAMPLLLLAAGHVRRDIPRALAAAGAEQAGVTIQQLPHLGCHPRIVELSAQRYREAVSDDPTDNTLLVLVGRGSRDPQATEEMQRFVELRVQQTPVSSVKIGYLAMAKPSLAEVLAEVHSSQPRRIVVQPHLLFPGRLLQQLEREVAAAERPLHASPWRVAEALGPGPVLAEAIVEIFRANLAGKNSPRAATVR